MTDEVMRIVELLPERRLPTDYATTPLLLAGSLLLGPTTMVVACTLLALGALLSGASAAGAPELFVVVAPKHDHIAKLINHEGMSVLFHHSTLAVVESANGTAPQLPADVALTGVGRTRDDAKYFVLLQQSTTKNVTGQSAHEWQHTVTRDNPKMRVVFANNTAMLMSANPLDWPKSTDLSADAEADDVFEGLELPKHTHYLPLHEPLTERAHENIRQVEQKMSAVRNVVIERLVEEVSAPALQRTVEHLATTWLTRQAATPGSWACADYLKQEFEQLGFETSFGGELRDGFSPNVVATKTGTRYPTRWVVIGAHYDSRGRNAADPEEIAPGANDDGSGIAAIVEMARITQAMGATYDYSLMIVGFAAEEQGLVGSNELAQRMLDDGDEIIGMYAADMIGYRVPGRNIQVGLPIVSHTPALTTLARVAFNLYVPEVETCEYTGCCTDNLPFYNRGFPASRFFEACGALDDPKYHTPEDDYPREGYGLDDYDIDGTLKAITKGMLATAWTLLNPTIE